MNEPLIKLTEVYKSYKTQARTINALNDVSLEFPNYGLFFICGRSGSGKSTLLNVLGGLTSVTSGEYFLDGARVDSLNEKSRRDLLLRRISFVFQESNLINDLSVRDNLLLAGVKKEEVPDVLSQVGLASMEYEKGKNLSGGEMQRVSVARALGRHSSIILMDEPTGSLDSSNANALFDLLKTLSKDKLIVVVTHDVGSASKYGDSVFHMEDGSLKEKTENSPTNIEESEKTPAKPIQNNKMPFGLAVKFALSGQGKKWWRTVLIWLIFTISTALSVFAGSFLFYDSAAAFYDALESHDIDGLAISHKEISEATSSYTTTYSYGNRLLKKAEGIFEYATGSLKAVAGNYPTSIQIVPISEAITFSGVSIDVPDEGEVVLSAFANAYMNEPTSVSFRFSSPIITGSTDSGFALTVSSFSFPVGYGEERIPYAQEEPSVVSQDAALNVWNELIYSVAFVSQGTFDDILSKRESIRFQGDNPFVASSASLNDYCKNSAVLEYREYEEMTLLAGNAPSALGEVIISDSLYQSIAYLMLEEMGIDISDLESGSSDDDVTIEPLGTTWSFRDLDNALNSIPYQTIPNLYNVFPNGLKIVGVFSAEYDQSRLIYLSSESFSTLQTSVSAYSGPVYAFDSRSRIANVLSEGGVISTSTLFSPVYSASSWKENGSFTIGFSVISGVLLALGVFLIIIFGNSEISAREKDIAILRSFGKPSILVTAIASLKNAFTVALSLVTGIIGGYVATGFMNNLLKQYNPIAYSFHLVNVAWYVPLIVIAVNVLMFLLTFFLSYYSLRKKNIADSLRLL